MQNVLSNETQNIRIVSQNSFKEKNDHKIFNFNDFIHNNETTNKNEQDSITVSTHKNSCDPLSNNYANEFKRKNNFHSFHKKMPIKDIFMEEPTKRKDNFGKEIKKGGKQKIAFADDLDIIKSFIPKNKNNEVQLNKSGKTKQFSPEKKSRYNLEDNGDIKRANSLKNGRSCMMKNFYNIFKGKSNLNKKFGNCNGHIIKIENLKEETKLNTFIVNKKALVVEENVSCSCYCSII